MDDLAESSVPRMRLQGIRKRFGATIALDGVDLSVNAGEVLALVGENGAGKSTLMKALSGAHQPDEGKMWLDGKPYHPRSPLDARRAGVCMIYQELSLAPHMSVMENILLGMEPTAGPFMRWGRLREIATDALAQLGRPDIRPETLVGQLSPADRQLVEIGRAIAVGCKVLVLDEPTSSLTSKDIRKLFDLIHTLRSRGYAIIYISHFLEEVKEITDRFTVLRDGKSVGEGLTADTPVSKFISLMVGRQVDQLYTRSDRPRGEVILDIRQLSGENGPESATLQLHRGEVLGIAGLIGAGRTELMRTIFGLDAVRSGQIKVKTWSGAATPAERWDQGVGLVSEDRKVEGLALSLSIADNLTLSDLKPFGPRGLVFPGSQEKVTRVWIKKFAVRCRSPWQPIGSLSGGNQQKIAIARLMHHQCDVLLLDEPTRGIDVGSKAQIYKLIDELALAGKAVLMVSSYLPELLGNCDRIAVMCRGKLGPAQDVAKLDEHQIMLQATGAAAMAGAAN